MTKIAQIFTGIFSKSEDMTDLRVKIQQIFDKLNCEAVIAGWNTSPEPYRVIIEEAKIRGKDVYLWLPVFSEEEEAFPALPALDQKGHPHVPMGSQGSESFAFFCPSALGNRTRIINIFEKYFSHLGFDGVFLDKIRTASFANGFYAALGCCCPLCQSHYRSAANVDMTDIAHRKRNNFLPSKIQGPTYEFSDPEVNRFFMAKAENISGAVKDLSRIFQSHNLKVGLDVYAPAYAYFVGQDIRKLSIHSDFIKPMMYRITEAPAGIPFEQRYLEQELEDTQHRVSAYWGSPESFQGLKNQIESLAGCNCPIYPGFEANYVDPICLNTGAYLTQNLRDFKELRAKGLVFSWNMLSADLPMLCSSLEEVFCE